MVLIYYSIYLRKERYYSLNSILSNLSNTIDQTDLQTVSNYLTQNYEQTVDNNYVARYLTFQLTDLNSSVQTPYGGQSQMTNYQLRR